ncbi:MAG: TGS domain-containing protein [Candidatus Abyssobacteria bacterium SURF_17]|jgi:ribosome-interacting GTPase 1|uniref:TGS domain-containing protein n=1 Tax=Candidatus Abyssobacteria bacterium SURF_17 TaxID=2093361 RepID=A0A419EYS3_9BACT|nr:MAG: TGS domain-containing protein [Candidatus Abyssubacteria bacterium SURF_17]
MPANLTPEYLEAEKAYKQAKTSTEKMECLERMLSTIPKHKGTEKMQADIKRRIAQLKERMEGERARKRGGVSLVVKREGAGKVVLIGPPNSGKSQLLCSLTNAKPEVAPYPFTTRLPVPAMMPFEDVLIQLVELPAIAEEHCEPATVDNIRNADLVLVVVDLSATDPLEQLTCTLALLEKVKIKLSLTGNGEGSPFGWTGKKALVVANKSDCDEDSVILSLMRELWEGDLPIIAVSAEKGLQLEELRLEIFRRLDIIRVYSKVPGKSLQKDAPFTLKTGSTLLDFAAAVHKDFTQKLKFGKVWGSSAFDGQSVSTDYVLADGDIVELHI